MMTTPRTGPESEYLEAQGRKNGQDTTIRYISYELFNTLHKASGNNVLYEIRSKWSALHKFDIPMNDKSLPMLFEAL